ncbi:MAG: hypothetical protein AAF717_13270 [Bacteroidota bacterium]
MSNLLKRPRHRIKTIIVFIVLLSFSCNENRNDLVETDTLLFDDLRPMTITGYDDHAMEPFLSMDGSVLFLNNLNAPTVNSNLHWCTRQNDSIFQYMGELGMVNNGPLVHQLRSIIPLILILRFSIGANLLFQGGDIRILKVLPIRWPEDLKIVSCNMKGRK